MKYLITQDQNGDVSVVSPVPVAALTYDGFKLILDELPPLPSGYKYIIDNGALSTAINSSQDNQKIVDDKIAVAFEEIEAETAETRKAGFSFNGNQFALDIYSQQHWQRLFMIMINDGHTTQNIPTLTNGVYSLTTQQAETFFTAYHVAASAILETERVAKELKRAELSQ